MVGNVAHILLGDVRNVVVHAAKEGDDILWLQQTHCTRLDKAAMLIRDVGTSLCGGGGSSRCRLVIVSEVHTGDVPGLVAALTHSYSALTSDTTCMLATCMYLGHYNVIIFCNYSWSVLVQESSKQGDGGQDSVAKG